MKEKLNLKGRKYIAVFHFKNTNLFSVYEIDKMEAETYKRMTSNYQFIFLTKKEAELLNK